MHRFNTGGLTGLKNGDKIMPTEGSCCLAHIEGLGRVERCRRCDELHVHVGALSFRISEAAFEQLSALVGRAVSALAVQRHVRGRSAPMPIASMERN